jgi:hypothetical protein
METTQTIDYALVKLQPVFDRLETMGIAGWQITIKQQMVEAYSALFLLVFLCIIASILLFVSFRMSKTIVPGEGPRGFFSQYQGPTAASIPLGISIILYTGLTMGVLENFTMILGKIINPEWYAIQALLHLIK